MTDSRTTLLSVRRTRLARLQVLQDKRSAQLRAQRTTGRRARQADVVPPVGFEPTLSVV